MGKDGLEGMFSTQCIIANLGHLRSPGERKVTEEITNSSEKIKETKGCCPYQRFRHLTLGFAKLIIKVVIQQEFGDTANLRHGNCC